MSYGHENCISLYDLKAIDEWLDGMVSDTYQDQPLAQDWARVAKVAEECGEAVSALIGATGQNPRKGVTNGTDKVLDELADVVWTALAGIQHFTKDTYKTEAIVMECLYKIRTRVPGIEG